MKSIFIDFIKYEKLGDGILSLSDIVDECILFKFKQEFEIKLDCSIKKTR